MTTQQQTPQTAECRVVVVNEILDTRDEFTLPETPDEAEGNCVAVVTAKNYLRWQSTRATRRLLSVGTLAPTRKPPGRRCRPFSTEPGRGTYYHDRDTETQRPPRAGLPLPFQTAWRLQ